MRIAAVLYNFIWLIIFMLTANDQSFCQDSLSLSETLTDTSESSIVIDHIYITGNQKTREYVILRELTFKEGDCFSSEALQSAIEQSNTNLLKLPLFNYVTIVKSSIDEYHTDINIHVEERWYLWPQFAIINNERNFNTWFQNKDLSKLDYRLTVKQYNVFGLNHILTIGISYGFTKEILLGYQNFAIDKEQKHVLGIFSWYSQYNSVFYRTINNKQESFTNSNENVLTAKYIKLSYTFRPQINFLHKFNIIYQELNASDSLLYSNPEFLAGSNTQNRFIEMQYQFVLDKRDSRSYPLNGFWFDIVAVKTGMNLKEESEINLFHIKTSIKDFYQLSGRFYGAHSITIKKSFENSQPYYFKESMGFYDFLRGYEYYVIEGEDFYLSKNVIKFELLPKTISYLNFIPIKKFKKIHYAIYLNAFIDFGYAHEKNEEKILQNTLSNKFLYSGGLGFDLVTYYDKVLRIEYSINSLKERGLFIHFMAPI